MRGNQGESTQDPGRGTGRDGVELRLDHLKVYFPVKRTLSAFITGRPRKVVKAVDDVSLDIHRDEVLGLVGETGCGKSTIARTILRMNPITAGTINYRGQEVHRLSGAQLKRFYSKVQMVWQDPASSLNPRMQAGEILSRPLMRFRNVSRGEAFERVRPVMRMVGLNEGEINRYPHEFSGGGKQRIVIARALINEPDFIIADEPTSSLDVSIQAQILNLIKRLKNDLGLTMLYISHNLATISFISTRVAVMYFGRVVEILPNRNLLRKNYHWYTRRLLEAIPRGRRIVNATVTQELDFRLNHEGCIYYYRCENAKPRCRQGPPELRQVEDEHFVSCHYPIE
jgi:oligopeptide/dipeptide ABC transporter ATP-binding protein